MQDIFTRYVAGQSPKTIARALNAGGIPGPGGCAWSPSTIHSHHDRGTGILNNELYVGRRVWGRLRYMIRPGHRETRLTAQPAARVARGGDAACALRCFNQTARGTCSNTRTIMCRELEGRVLRAIKERFFAPRVSRNSVAVMSEETNRLRRERRAQIANAPKEIAGIERRQKELLNLLLDGLGDIEVFKGEVRQLEDRKKELKALLASAKTEPALPALHPHLAAVFRERVEQLAAALD